MKTYERQVERPPRWAHNQLMFRCCSTPREDPVLEQVLNRDPFYRQIIAGLGEPLDPELFERCAADLLRDELPTLVPIRGGSDAGMDAAVADLQGTAYPLVCTTSEDVIGNLTRNLKKYMQEGQTRRRAVLATSRSLTAKRRTNLEKRAADLGFELVQIYDQAAFADRLYRNPAWCRELLNLTGAPPALSAVPRSRRPLLGDALIGREQDLSWVRDSKGDRLVVGPPGSGKTSLLYALVRGDWGLFLTDDDPERIANDLRSQQPSVIIVDDAHVHLGALERLRHLRQEVDASFDIVATSWPGRHEHVAEALNLLASQVRELDLLTRDEIVAVVRSAGIAGPDPLIREIVDQAEGRPGLAVTLAILCLRGGLQDVVFGEALTRNLRDALHPVVGDQGLRLLAAFALGGDSGLPVDAVADELGLSSLAVSTQIAEFAFGGVVSERIGEDGQIFVVVRPQALRHALVRDVFFRGPGRLRYQPLIRHVTSLSDATRTLVGAHAVGALIPQEALRSLLESAASPSAWEEYARLGPDEATWVVEHHPELVTHVAEPALRHVPEVVVPVLLDLAVDDERPRHQNPDHPLRLIESWIRDSEPWTGTGSRRRSELMRSAVTWLRAGGDEAIALQAILPALSPDFETLGADPGAGRKVSWSEGLLAEPELKVIRDLWPKARDALRSMDRPGWSRVFEMIGDWAAPLGWPGPIPHTTMELLRSTAAEMLRDIVQLVPEHQGVALRAQEMGERLGLDLKVSVDPAFTTLFGRFVRPDVEDWETVRRETAKAVRDLATKWIDEDPGTIVARLATMERQASEANPQGPRRTSDLAEELAARTASPNVWLAAMLDHSLASSTVAPFVAQVVVTREPGWEKLTLTAMARSELRHQVIRIILSMPDPPTTLLESALAELEEHRDLVEELCMDGVVPEPTLVHLLEHHDVSVAGAAAVGEWHRRPQGQVRATLARLWRRAVRRHPTTNGYWFSEIIRTDPQLAHDWLRAQLRAGSRLRFFFDDDPVAVAINALDHEGRRCMLGSLPDNLQDPTIVTRLVGNDVEVYRALLSDQRVAAFHLVPLAGPVKSGWPMLAKAALTRGFRQDQIVRALFAAPMSWIGYESAVWSGWVEDLEQLARTDDPAIHPIAVLALERARANRDRALAQERHEAVFGPASW